MNEPVLSAQSLGRRFHEGDIVISNHGGTIGQHLNNVAMYTPVFNPEGELAAFMLVVIVLSLLARALGRKAT